VFHGVARNFNPDVAKAAGALSEKDVHSRKINGCQGSL
jgi:hypothetical protein